MDPTLVTLEEIHEAYRVVSKIVHRTPLIPLKESDRPETFVKCENLQRIGAFKIRGAYNAIANLPAETEGVVAYSSGNHAQGVALAAKLRGLKACICTLDQAVQHKIEGAKRLGAEVILAGKTSEAIKARAEALAAERGWALIPPFNHPHIIAGQGTVGLEILEDLPAVRAIVVPIGGGGLISGISTVVKAMKPGVKVFGVEPEGAPKMFESVRKGELVTLPPTKTIADGLKPVRAGDLTFAHVRKNVDEIVLVSDEEILEATRHLILREKLVVEPSGAAPVAAVRSGKLKLPDGPAVCVLSGGNADLAAILG